MSIGTQLPQHTDTNTDTDTDIDTNIEAPFGSIT